MSDNRYYVNYNYSPSRPCFSLGLHQLAWQCGSVGPTRMSTVVPSEFSEHRTQFDRVVHEGFDFHKPQYADYCQPLQPAPNSAAALGKPGFPPKIQDGCVR